MSSTAQKIGQAAQLACLLEVSSYPKPGNVSPHREYDDLKFQDFLASAVAIRSAVEEAAEAGMKSAGRKAEAGSVERTMGKRELRDVPVPLGKLILKAAEDTAALGVAGNVNSGIILLLVPLAAAWARKERTGESLERASARIMAQTTPEDAVLFYRALKTLKPRLPKVKSLDVFDEGSEKLIREKKLGLGQVLGLSRDQVAKEVLNGYPVSQKAAEEFKRALKKGGDVKLAVAQAFLWILGKHLDGLVMKKAGKRKAEWVSREARKVLSMGGAFTEKGCEQAGKLDETLYSLGRDHNPGSTADLVCSALFLALAEKL